MHKIMQYVNTYIYYVQKLQIIMYVRTYVTIYKYNLFYKIWYHAMHPSVSV